MAADESLTGLDPFLRISRIPGCRPDYVQGGGGNTSSKLDNTRMAVKASGFRMKDVSEQDGFVILDYARIREYLAATVQTGQHPSDEACQTFIRAAAIPLTGVPDRRPSVEAGFHALLKTHVLHTHPVYANILTCASEGESFARELFSSDPFRTVWLPYLRPGIQLSLGIAETIRQYGSIPDVWFIENHGLIVTGDDPEQTIRLHDSVNDRIRDNLPGLEPFPSISLSSMDRTSFSSRTEFKGRALSDFVDAGSLERDILYPDQLVYLNANASANRLIRTDAGLSYHVSASDAESIEETLLGYVYVLESIRTLGWNVRNLSKPEELFIRGWESEDYRRKLASEKTNP
jgi:ribulose-5-phosphate 4-epimerase/fuculose-1-phosphate aldolase